SALNYPKIAFNLVNDGKSLFKTNGNGKLDQVIAQVYNLEIAQNTKPFLISNNDFKISGYLSNHHATKNNKRSINIFINQRLVYNKELINTIIKSYGQYLMERRYPIVVINIECDYKLVDVNVHPAKREVRISKIEDLLSLIEQGISEHFKLKQETFIKQVHYQQPQLFNEAIKINTIPTSSISSTRAYNHNIQEEAKQDLNEEIINYEVNDHLEVTTKLPVYRNFKVLGQFSATYIIATSDLGLHLIDQHAAMERINYEKMVKDYQTNTYYELITPLIINLTLSEKTKLIDLTSNLKDLGFSFEIMHNNDIIFRKIPTWINQDHALEYVEQALSYLLGFNKDNITNIKQEELIQAACKNSLKANQILSLIEQQTLLDDLLKTNNYDHCPHGRPIILSYSINDVEKLFKRI
ncbi:MAG: hypothetical protein ACRCTA_02740, partial [Bacilli bacterium]